MTRIIWPARSAADERAASSAFVASLNHYTCSSCGLPSTIPGTCEYPGDDDEKCGGELVLVDHHGEAA